MNREFPDRSGPDAGFTLTAARLERKILKLALVMILTASILTFVQNLILKTHIGQTVLSSASALFAIFGLVMVPRLKNIRVFVYAMIVFFYFLLVALWFFSEGSAGSTPSVYFVFITMGVVFVHTRHRIPFIALTMLTLASMLFVEYYFPAAVFRYDTPEQRFLDAIITFMASMLVTGLVIYLVFNHYLTALKEIKTLKGMLSVCSYCNKIRSRDGHWDRFEAYFTKHSETEFTHGICPQCARQLYPDIEIVDANTSDRFG